MWACEPPLTVIPSRPGTVIVTTTPTEVEYDCVLLIVSTSPATVVPTRGRMFSWAVTSTAWAPPTWIVTPIPFADSIRENVSTVRTSLFVGPEPDTPRMPQAPSTRAMDAPIASTRTRA